VEDAAFISVLLRVGVYIDVEAFCTLLFREPGFVSFLVEFASLAP